MKPPACSRRAVVARALAGGLAAAWPLHRAHAQPQPTPRARALLMVVADYGEPKLNLPGAQPDLERARAMARWMGADNSRSQVLRDRALTLLALDSALNALARQARGDETVFIYFSGHGQQVEGQRFGSASRCSEGLVLSGGEMYLDAAIQHHLQQIGRKALQVLMLSDTCHSGGLPTKSFTLPRAVAEPGAPEPDAMPKLFPRATQIAPGSTIPGSCGNAINKGYDPGAGPEPRWLHVAASRADEVAWSTPRGSYATEAWHRVFQNARDNTRTTRLDGVSLVSQGQLLLRRQQRRQTLTASGVADMAWYLG
jgi:hypothetical protein